eukprot:2654143-Prymnesium_polylepis.1
MADGGQVLCRRGIGGMQAAARRGAHDRWYGRARARARGLLSALELDCSLEGGCLPVLLCACECPCQVAPSG